MKNSNQKKFRPYVRRANGKEKAETIIEALNLAYYRLSGKPFFVMVQHGFPNLSILSGRTKAEVKGKPLLVALKKRTFREWAKSVQGIARRNSETKQRSATTAEVVNGDGEDDLADN